MSIQFRTRSKGWSIDPTLLQGACCKDGECLGPFYNPFECAAADGEWMGNGINCNDIDCAEGSRAASVVGSCCINGFCYAIDEEKCNCRGGVYLGTGIDCVQADCCGVNLPSNTSTSTMACCYDGGTCRDLSPCECLETKGVPRGPGTSCSTHDCQLTGLTASYRGACCIDGYCKGPTGESHETYAQYGYTAGDCVVLGGIFGGSGSTCGSNHETISGITWPCSFPRGSCCFGTAPYDGVLYCGDGHTCGSCLNPVGAGGSGGQNWVRGLTCGDVIDDHGGWWDGTRCYVEEFETGSCCVPNYYESSDGSRTFIENYNCLDDITINNCERLGGLFKSYTENVGVSGPPEIKRYLQRGQHPGTCRDKQDISTLTEQDMIRAYAGIYKISGTNIWPQNGGVPGPMDHEGFSQLYSIGDGPERDKPKNVNFIQLNYKETGHPTGYGCPSSDPSGEGCERDFRDFYELCKSIGSGKIRIQHVSDQPFSTDEYASDLTPGDGRKVWAEWKYNDVKNPLGHTNVFSFQDLDYIDGSNDGEIFFETSAWCRCRNCPGWGNCEGDPGCNCDLGHPHYCSPYCGCPSAEGTGTDGANCCTRQPAWYYHVYIIPDEGGIPFDELRCADGLDCCERYEEDEETRCSQGPEGACCSFDNDGKYINCVQSTLLDCDLLGQSNPSINTFFHEEEECSEEICVDEGVGSDRNIARSCCRWKKSNGKYLGCFSQEDCSPRQDEIIRHFNEPCSSLKDKCRSIEIGASVNKSVKTSNRSLISNVNINSTNKCLDSRDTNYKINKDSEVLDYTTSITNTLPSSIATKITDPHMFDCETCGSSFNRNRGNCFWQSTLLENRTAEECLEIGGVFDGCLGRPYETVFESLGGRRSENIPDATAQKNESNFNRSQTTGTSGTLGACCIAQNATDVTKRSCQITTDAGCWNLQETLSLPTTWLGPGTVCGDWNSTYGYQECMANTFACCCSDESNTIIAKYSDDSTRLFSCLQISEYEQTQYGSCDNSGQIGSDGLVCGGSGTVGKLGSNCVDNYSGEWDKDSTDGIADNCMLGDNLRGACCSCVGWCDGEFNTNTEKDYRPGPPWAESEVACGFGTSSDPLSTAYPMCYDSLTEDECLAKTEYWRTHPTDAKPDVEFTWLGPKSKCTHSGFENYGDYETVVSVDPDGVSNNFSGCLAGWACGSKDTSPFYCGGSNDEPDCKGFPGYAVNGVSETWIKWKSPHNIFNNNCVGRDGILNESCLEDSASWIVRNFYATDGCYGDSPFEDSYPVLTNNNIDAAGCPFCNAASISPSDWNSLDYANLRNSYFRLGFDHTTGPAMCDELGRTSYIDLSDGTTVSSSGSFGSCCINGTCHRWPEKVCVEELGGVYIKDGVCNGVSCPTNSGLCLLCSGHSAVPENIKDELPCCAGWIDDQTNCDKIGGKWFPTGIEKLEEFCSSNQCNNKKNFNILESDAVVGGSSTIKSTTLVSDDSVSKDFATEEPHSNWNPCLCGCCLDGNTCYDTESWYECEAAGGNCWHHGTGCEGGGCESSTENETTPNSRNEVNYEYTESWMPPSGNIKYEKFIDGWQLGFKDSMVPFLGFKNIFEAPILNDHSQCPFAAIPNQVYYKTSDSGIPFPLDPTSFQYIQGRGDNKLLIGKDPRVSRKYWNSIKNDVKELWLTRYYPTPDNSLSSTNILEPYFISKLHTRTVPMLKTLVINPARYGNGRKVPNFPDSWGSCSLHSCNNWKSSYGSGYHLSNDLTAINSTLETLVAADSSIDSGISYLKLHNYSKLKNLYIHNNSLSILDLKNLKSLENLWVQNNNLGNSSAIIANSGLMKQDSLQVDEYSSTIKTIYAQNNKLKTLSDKKNISLPKLVVLDISHNNISNLSFNAPSLKYLNASGCNLSGSVNIGSPNSLEEIIFDSVSLNSFTIGTKNNRPINLRSLRISGSNLAVLNCGIEKTNKYSGNMMNNLEYISLSNNPRLRTLILPSPSNSESGVVGRYPRYIDVNSTLLDDSFLEQAAFSPNGYPDGHLLEVSLVGTRISKEAIDRLVELWDSHDNKHILVAGYRGFEDPVTDVSRETDARTQGSESIISRTRRTSDGSTRSSGGMSSNY